MAHYKPVILPALLLLLWAILAILINNPFILPRPEAVMLILASPGTGLVGSESLLTHASVSLIRVGTGFLLAALLAIPTGIIIGRSAALYDLCNPLIQILRPVPPIAWMPLVIGWFRIGASSMICIIFIGAFFPVLINVIDGVHAVRSSWLEVARSLGATHGEILRSVVLPAAMPGVWTGMRVAFGVAWMCVVAAEMLPGTTAGLGYLIMYAYNLGQIQIIIAGIIVIGIIGLCIDTIFRIIGDRWFGWRASER
ncbi:MAG TPA: ABC transporter permease [Methanospirillum sp.]|nr:ABC transporter permease [Methanospirillum sp.]